MEEENDPLGQVIHLHSYVEAKKGYPSYKCAVDEHNAQLRPSWMAQSCSKYSQACFIACFQLVARLATHLRLKQIIHFTYMCFLINFVTRQQLIKSKVCACDWLSVQTPLWKTAGYTLRNEMFDFLKLGKLLLVSLNLVV